MRRGERSAEWTDQAASVRRDVHALMASRGGLLLRCRRLEDEGGLEHPPGVGADFDRNVCSILVSRQVARKAAQCLRRLDLCFALGSKLQSLIVGIEAGVVSDIEKVPDHGAASQREYRRQPRLGRTVPNYFGGWNPGTVPIPGRGWRPVGRRECQDRRLQVGQS